MNPEPLIKSQLDLESLKLESQSLSPPLSSSPPRMNLRSATYHTAQEVKNGLDSDSEGMEDKNNVTTDTGDESEDRFDSSDDNDFDPIQSTDYVAADDNMD